VDPRNTESYHQLASVFQKVMALKTFEHKFITILHAPLDQDSIDKMMGLGQWALNIRSDRNTQQRTLNIRSDRNDPPSIIILEKVRAACIEFVLIELYAKGIDQHSLDVILGGWPAFFLQPTHDWYVFIERRLQQAFLN
jgi:hypothetical protein